MDHSIAARLVTVLLLVFGLANSSKIKDRRIIRQDDLSPESSVSPGSEEAYVTLLYGSFLLGVRVLGQSLRESGTERDLVVLCTQDVPNLSMEILASDGWIIKSVQSFYNPYFEKDTPGHITKLLMWTLTEYRRIVFIDADALVLANVDELFRCGIFCAVYRHSDLFNTGVVVLKPSLEVYQDIRRKLGQLPSYTGGDQGFLNFYYESLLYATMFNATDPEEHEEAMRLPAGYNADVGTYYMRSGWSDMPSGDVKIIHYTLGPVKPWKWWAYFLFDLNWQWNALRERMPNGNSDPPLITLTTFIPLIVLVAYYITSRVWSRFYGSICKHTKVIKFLIWFSPVDGVSAKVFPTCAMLLSYYLAFFMFPTSMHPFKASFIYCWWILFYMVLFYTFYCHLVYAMGHLYGQHKLNRCLDPKLESFLFMMMFVLVYILQVTVPLCIATFSHRLYALIFMLVLSLVYGHVVGRHLVKVWFGHETLSTCV